MMNLVGNMGVDTPSILEDGNRVISNLPWQGWALLALVALVGLYFASKERIRNLPPSPGALPIVGSFPFMGAKDGEPAHQTFGRLAEKFGPILYLDMGAAPSIVVSNSDVARQILRENDRIFASRPYLSAGKYMGMNFQSVVFAPSGAYYKRLRKLYTQHLLSPKRVHAAHETRENSVFHMLESIYLHQSMDEGEFVNLSSLLRDLSLNSLLGLVFGRKDGKLKESVGGGRVNMDELKKIIKEAVELGGEFNVGDFITIARWLDWNGVIRRMKRLMEKMKRAAAAMIAEYEMSETRKSPEDPNSSILDSLLALDGEDKLSPDAMAAVMFDMIIAGSDTTSASADWTMAELLRQPQLVGKLQAELDAVVGKASFVHESDIPKLPYLQAVIKESLRLHPPAPLGIPHYSTKSCVVAGFNIPAGTTALLNIWAINRDAAQWTDPLCFDPDRFFQKSPDIGAFGTAYHFLPFSSGRRGCSGMLLGLTMAQLTVANLVHCFDFQAFGMKNEDINVKKETTGLVSSRAVDLWVHSKPRLPTHLYNRSSEPRGQLEMERSSPYYS